MRGVPSIGVVPLWDEHRESYWMLPGYFEGVERAGGLPFMLPMRDDAASIEEIAARFDGFLFTGGHDVSPKLYGEEPLPECGKVIEARDRMEAMLFEEAALRMDKPVLGICRGLQAINVFLGGTLYQDLALQVPQSDVCHRQMPPYDVPVHAVTLKQGGLLARLFDAEALQVNSHHHQAIRGLSPRLEALAHAPDGLVEAVRLPEGRFVVGVQWHPEFCPQSPASGALFAAFVEACRTGGRCSER